MEMAMVWLSLVSAAAAVASAVVAWATRADAIRSAADAVRAEQSAADARADVAQALLEANALTKERLDEKRARVDRDQRFRIASTLENWANNAFQNGLSGKHSHAGWSEAYRLSLEYGIAHDLVMWARDAVEHWSADIAADPDDDVTYREVVVSFGMTVRGYVENPREFEEFMADIRANRKPRVNGGDTFD